MEQPPEKTNSNPFSQGRNLNLPPHLRGKRKSQLPWFWGSSLLLTPFWVWFVFSLKQISEIKITFTLSHKNNHILKIVFSEFCNKICLALKIGSIFLVVCPYFPSPACLLLRKPGQTDNNKPKLQQTTIEVILMFFLTWEDWKTLWLCAPWLPQLCLWGWSSSAELVARKSKGLVDFCSGSLWSLSHIQDVLLPEQVGKATPLPSLFLWAVSKLNSQWFQYLLCKTRRLLGWLGLAVPYQIAGSHGDVRLFMPVSTRKLSRGQFLLARC